MTLVLPAAAYCSNQTAKNHLFATISSGNSRNSSMPCVFDGEPLDFESALMTDWPSLKDITDYDASSEDTAKTTPGLGEKSPSSKRKYAQGNEENDEATESKKPCLDDSAQSSLSPCSSSNDDANHHALTSPPSSPSSESASDSSPVRKAEELPDEGSSSIEVDEDEDLFLPRRRVPQMWNSRQRWKDERKKVLKMSVNKLTEIEDPELWLLRSVLINNTIKKLHQDIRNERQAKLRHRQQKLEFYTERYEHPSQLSSVHHRVPLSTTTNYNEPSSYHHQQDYASEKKSQMDTHPSDLYDDTSCDEIFGISEDFLRVTIPDRRVSSPIPTTPVQDSTTGDDSAKNCESTPMEVMSTSCCSSTSGIDCDMNSDLPRNSLSPFNRGRTQTGLSAPSSVEESSSSNSRHVEGLLPQPPVTTASGGSQCSTQFRTNHDCVGASVGGRNGLGRDNTFPPRVPILDSVVYHSLLASLESS